MKSLGILSLMPIFAALFVSSCTTETSDYGVSSYHNYRGIDHYESGRLDEATREFKKAVAVRPDSAKMHFNLGIAHYENGEQDKATEEFKRALSINPAYVEARSARGNVFMDNGKVEEALLQYKEAIEVDGNYADVHNNLGNAYWLMGMREQAISKYKDAVELNPNLDIAYVNLGHAYTEEGMLDEALKKLTKASELNPDMAEVHHYLADVYYEMGMLEEAVSEYKKGISYYGPDAPARRLAMANSQMALAYYRVGEYGEAMSRFKRVLELDPNFARATVPEAEPSHKATSVEVLMETVSRERELAESYSSMGDKVKALEQWRSLIVHCLEAGSMPGARIERDALEEACSSFNELLQADTFDKASQKIHLTMAQAYLKKGDIEEAQFELKKALEINPTLLGARLDLVKILIKENDPESALREAGKVALLYPGNEEAELLLGNVYLKMDMLDKAMEQYNKVLESSTGRASVHNNRGIVYVGQNRLDDAIREYRTAMGTVPSSARLHMNLGRAYYRKGMAEAADLEFDRALGLNPNLASAYKGKAMIDEDAARLEEAIANYEQALGFFDENRYLQKAEIHDHLASIYSKKYMTELAVSELLKTLELRLSVITGYDEQGLEYYGKSMFEEAFRYWERSLELKPVLAGLYERLGTCYVRTARYDEATLVYRNAANMYSRKKSKALMHYNIADIMLEEGLLESAITEYEKAIELDPALGNAYVGLGLVYDKRGILKKAVSYYKKALEIDPSLAEAHKNLGLCYHKQGLKKEAKKEFAIYNNKTLKE
ncbi:MAG: tetratricopeptide repeat protein [Candidatus Brocadiales bacterium]|nr:tetratricopeptide repeat protein [Candidatus Bathyanammoxibius amoris]